MRLTKSKNTYLVVREMVNHVICRRTGQVVATGYQTYIGQGGKKYRFFHKDWQKDMDLTKQQFDANYRIEKVEYK
ncbi:hypothetical protein ENHY17A_110248 [Moraxellaceae bacterium 17A]|nr:hypothetical protein ENHY17A_110248 [Moraxellaceae bacterium 17A]